MNVIAAIRWISPVDSFFPKITAIVVDTAKPAIAPKATEIGALCSTARAIVAS